MNYSPLFKPPLTRKLKSGRVRLSPGEDVGEHTTEKREEVIVVLKGRATLDIEGRSIVLKEGDAHYIEEGKIHNILNKTNREVEYIYVVGLFN